MTPAPSRSLALQAFFYPYRGLKFLFAHPRLLGYAAVPFAINTLLYAGVIWFAGSRFGSWVTALIPQGEAWYWSVLFYALWVVFAAVLFLLVAFTFALLGNLLLEPFNDLLSEQVEWAYTGDRREEPFRLGVFWADAGRSFATGLRRIALWAPGALVLWAGSFLFWPLTPLLALYTAFFLGWAYLDYSMDRWRFGFAAKRRTARQNLSAFLTFGAGAALLLLIPLLSFLAIPVCVTGATLLFCDLRSRGKLPQATGSGVDAEVAPKGAPPR
ncbi:MAG: EI24 domain-containing protein [Deferrisomatales bacterium]|nr:EI24 domain-containing protein [Deferrisomatales bacterium]